MIDPISPRMYRENDRLACRVLELEALLNDSVPRSRFNAVDNEVEQLKVDLALTREAAKTEIRRLLKRDIKNLNKLIAHLNDILACRIDGLLSLK